MKRLILLPIITIISITIFGQSSFDLGLGYCLYSNNYNDYTRIDGVTLNLGYEYTLNEFLSIRTGLDANVSRENYYFSYYRRSFIPETEEYSLIVLVDDKSDNYSVNVQWPVSLAAKLFDSDFSLVAGLLVGIDNLVIFGDAFAGSDPEIVPTTPSPYYKDWPISRKLSFGHQVGLQYRPLDRFFFSLEFKTIKNKEFGFNNIGLKLMYKLNKPRL